MATILCIETATTNCSVALSVNGSVIVLREDNSAGYSHAERLHLYIEEVLANGKVDRNELDAVAVSKGPGSYTGLRIGVSAAKGLCFALDIPLLSIPTLELLSKQLIEFNGDKVAMLDARRMEVYAAIFSSEGEEIRETRAEVLSSDSFLEFLDKGPTIIIGSGVEKFEALCDHENAIFIKDRFPSAREMALLAETKYEKSDIEDVAYFEPYYLKDFIGNKLVK